MKLLAGDVLVVQEDRNSVASRLVAWSTKSPWTHCGLVLDPDDFVDAWIPRVRRIPLHRMLYEWEASRRSYRVLRLPGLTLAQQQATVAKATTYIGRWYNARAAIRYGLGGSFSHDGEGRLVCSRLITASYLKGAGVNLFDRTVLADYPHNHPRLHNLTHGYAVPADLLRCKLMTAYRWTPHAGVCDYT